MKNHGLYTYIWYHYVNDLLISYTTVMCDQTFLCLLVEDTEKN
jgi:hypothetical protein